MKIVEQKQFNNISCEEVRRLFDYDPETGDLLWRIKPAKNIIAGSVVNAGCSGGYKKVSIDKKRYKVHRVVWIWNHGYDSEHFIDHIDKNKSNNRIENLREVNKQCNMRNSSLRKTSRSGVKGVQQPIGRAGALVAQIVINGKARHLISTTDKLEAACHRLAAEQCLGWIDCDKDSSAYSFVAREIGRRF